MSTSALVHTEQLAEFARALDIGQATAGDRKKAVASYEKALSLTEDEEQKKRIRGEIAKLKP